MGGPVKVHSQRKHRRKKNRGGERLVEWRLLHRTSEYKEMREKRRAAGDCVVSDPEPMSVETVEVTATTTSDQIICDEEQSNHLLSDLVLEQATDDNKDGDQLQGRRIVDIGFVFNEIKRISVHEPFDCGFENMTFVKEKEEGLRSGFKFQCSMCNVIETIWSEPSIKSSNRMDINSSAVAGIMSIGSGYYGMQQIMGAMDVRCMSSTTYDRYHNKVADGWEKTALEEMREAAEEEVRLAKQRGDISPDGVPLLTVVADASWAKRSYRTNYSSLSGVAAIVGFYTRKVLFIGVRNKFCTTCARAEKNKTTTKNHACYKNWDSSSSSMESDIIAEGFRQSEEMYGVRYARLIADGDSSVYNNLLATRPYPNLTVDKIECKNHLLRNYCNKLRSISADTAKYIGPDGTAMSTKTQRKRIEASILRLRSAVSKAIAYRKTPGEEDKTRVIELRKDLLNGPSHVFGEHDKCKERNYFCDGPKNNETNLVPVLKTMGLYHKIMTAVGTLVDNARSLIVDVNSNYAEHFNSIVAKFIGGKRTNYAKKRSYQARCAAAVVSHNSGTPHYKLHKAMYECSPGKFSKSYELRRKDKVLKRAQLRLKTPKSRRRLLVGNSKSDPHYGEDAQKPDLREEEYAMKAEEFWGSLKKTEEEIKLIEATTRLQQESTLWREERRRLLTASNFGQVCKRLPHTSCEKIVTRLLYTHEIDVQSVRYGRENEAVAIQELKAAGMEISECGLFIDMELPYLAATPDGLLGDDGIIEIKCPSAAGNLTPEEAIAQKKGVFSNFWRENKKTKKVEVNKSHSYFYQIQGQLRVTKKKHCLFVVWTPKGMKTQTIYKDDEFWETQMEEKLTSFYKYCLLPEILDPRKPRNMTIRNPSYIIEAQKKRKKTHEHVI